MENKLHTTRVIIEFYLLMKITSFLSDKFIFLFGSEKNSNIKELHQYNIEELLKEKNILIKDFQIGKNFAEILTNNGIVLTAGDNSLGQLGRISSQNINENISFKKVDLP